MGRELSVTPQARKLLRHFNKAGTITQRQALIDYGVQSLTKRISELRAAGFSIATTFRRHPTTGQRYARYTFIGRA